MHNSRGGRIVCCLGALLAAGGFLFGLEAQQPSAGAPVPSAAHRDVINRYCVSCHNGRLKTGGLALDSVVAADVPQNPAAWSYRTQTGNFILEIPTCCPFSVA